MMCQQTIEKLRAMRLRGMAEVYQQQLEMRRWLGSPLTNAWPCWWMVRAPIVLFPDPHSAAMIPRRVASSILTAAAMTCA